MKTKRTAERNIFADDWEVSERLADIEAMRQSLRDSFSDLVQLKNEWLEADRRYSQDLIAKLQRIEIHLAHIHKQAESTA